MNVDLLMWEKLNKLNEETNKTVINGITFEIGEYSIDLRHDTRIEVDLYKSTYAVATLRLDYADILEDAKFIWEPDGDPTYADFGSQRVLYDDGKGELERVEIAPLEPYDERYFEFSDDYPNGMDIDRAEVLSMLGVTAEQLTKLETDAKEFANDFLKPRVEEYVKDHPEYWPDRDNDDYQDLNPEREE